MSSNPSKTAAATEDNEPSMEEILASIRKIIADDSLGTKKDEAPPPKRPAKPEPAAPAPAPEPEVAALPDDEDADVLDLAEVASVAQRPVQVEIPVAPVVTPDPLEEEMMMPEPVEVMVAPPPPAFAATDVPRAPVTNVTTLEDRIISDNTSSLVGQAFAQLSLSKHTPMPAMGRSLEDVVVELLRPMLRGWVDEHLPSIVEKLVKAEIERVARGG